MVVFFRNRKSDEVLNNFELCQTSHIPRKDYQSRYSYPIQQWQLCKRYPDFPDHNNRQSVIKYQTMTQVVIFIQVSKLLVELFNSFLCRKIGPLHIANILHVESIASKVERIIETSVNFLEELIRSQAFSGFEKFISLDELPNVMLVCFEIMPD